MNRRKHRELKNNSIEELNVMKEKRNKKLEQNERGRRRVSQREDIMALLTLYFSSIPGEGSTPKAAFNPEIGTNTDYYPDISPLGQYLHQPLDLT